jgi:hypothetical protein
MALYTIVLWERPRNASSRATEKTGVFTYMMVRVYGSHKNYDAGDEKPWLL